MLRRALALPLMFAICADAALAAGCGSHGGPGYRGPNGRCVGWGSLTAICGDPPTTRCALDGHKPPTPPTQAPSAASSSPVAPTAANQNGALPLNPAVTQATIGSTICVPGWTATVRPPASYTNRLKVRLMRTHGLPLELIGDFQLDHQIPLALGGAPSDQRNLQLEDADDAEQKDEVEKCLARAVCAGRISLDDARRRISSDWREAGKACF
jgi:hypothetical protein